MHSFILKYGALGLVEGEDIGGVVEGVLGGGVQGDGGLQLVAGLRHFPSAPAWAGRDF